MDAALTNINKHSFLHIIPWSVLFAMVEPRAFCHYTDVMTNAGKDEASKKKKDHVRDGAGRESGNADRNEPASPLPDHTRSRDVTESYALDSDKITIIEALATLDGPMCGVLSDRSGLDHCVILQPNARRDPEQPVLFFDLDNTLYSRDLGIAEEMGERIQLYFQHHLALPAEESRLLGHQYYLDYGLAIKGLLHNFHIDPATYDAFVDGGLQLGSKLRPDKRLAGLLKRTHARCWVFTNAGIQHARRVLRLLGLEGLFEGIIYCNYGEPDFPAKPERSAFERAMRAAEIVGRPDLCWFVDDNVTNVRVARSLGWHAVHLDEQQAELEWLRLGREQKCSEAGAHRREDHIREEEEGCITCLYDIERAFPNLFKSDHE